MASAPRTEMICSTLASITLTYASNRTSVLSSLNKVIQFPRIGISGSSISENPVCRKPSFREDRDRFSREPAYHYLLQREFEEHSCKLRALNDRGDNSPEGELTDGTLDQLAKFERAKTAERSRRGKLRKAREEKILRGPKPPYGFRYNATRDGYEVDEEAMQVVRRIFRMVG